MERTRVAVLLDRHQPGRSPRSIAASASLPSLGDWLRPGERPAELIPPEAMIRVAMTLDLPVSMVSRAFTGTWYDLNGWEWNHFHRGDRVVVFSAPDPATGARRATRGTVRDVDPLDIIEVEFDDGTRYSRIPETEGMICHASGGCRCSLPR